MAVCLHDPEVSIFGDTILVGAARDSLSGKKDFLGESGTNHYEIPGEFLPSSAIMMNMTGLNENGLICCSLCKT